MSLFFLRYGHIPFTRPRVLEIVSSRRVLSKRSTSVGVGDNPSETD